MISNIKRLYWLSAICAIGLTANATPAVVKITTNAPAGNTIRIYTQPFGATVTGAESDGFLGTYISPGPGHEITVTLEGMTELECYSTSSYTNQFTSLEVNAPDLRILRCHGNELSNLDLSNCPSLETLNCSSNQLTSLSLSGCSSLEKIEAGNNSLTEMGNVNLANLAYLDLSHNSLSSVDLSGYPALEEIYLDNNLLTAIDFGSNPQLWWGRVQSNKLNDAAMTAMTESISDATRSPALLYVVDTRDTAEENYCSVASVTRLANKGWVAMDWQAGAENPAYIGTPYNGADYVPEVSTRTITMTTSRAVGSTIRLKITASGDVSISGVSETTSVTGTNTFTLTSQEVVVSGDVTDFECKDNELTSLTFSGEPLLRGLDCSNNNIRKLEVKNAKAMTQLHAQKNRLTSLNLEGCDALLRVDCYDNALKGAAMTGFIASLYNDTQSKEPYLFVIDTRSETEENICTTTQVTSATDKNWVVYDYIGGDRWGMGTIYAGSEPTGPEYPAEYFTLTRSTGGEYSLAVTFSDSEYVPVVEGAEVLAWNGEQLMIRFTENTATVYGDATVVRALYGQLEDVDVTNLPNLTELNVALNDLTELDLSGNPQLVTLSAEANLLTTLDLSANSDLTYVNCYGNNISGSGMTSMIESLPMRSLTYYGTLIVYDASYSEENNICMSSDVRAAAEKYWVAAELNEEGSPVPYPGYDAVGIETVGSDADAPAEYFTLQGTRVEGEPSAGIYIVRKGNKVTKKVIL